MCRFTFAEENFKSARRLEDYSLCKITNSFAVVTFLDY